MAEEYRETIGYTTENIARIASAGGKGKESKDIFTTQGAVTRAGELEDKIDELKLQQKDEMDKPESEFAVLSTDQKTVDELEQQISKLQTKRNQELQDAGNSLFKRKWEERISDRRIYPKQMGESDTDYQTRSQGYVSEIKSEVETEIKSLIQKERMERKQRQAGYQEQQYPI